MLFRSCFLGVLDPAANCLTFASAGHGPILFYDRAADGFEELAATAVPLGILDGVSFQDTPSRTLRKGDLAAIVTDGLFEALNSAGEQFGIGRICDLLRANRDLPAGEMIARLRAAVAEWSGDLPQADDLTAVIIRRL